MGRKRNKDPETHLGSFKGNREQKEPVLKTIVVREQATVWAHAHTRARIFRVEVGKQECYVM